MWLFKFVLIKVKIRFLSHSSNISQLNSNMWLGLVYQKSQIQNISIKKPYWTRLIYTIVGHFKESFFLGSHNCITFIHYLSYTIKSNNKTKQKKNCQLVLEPGKTCKVTLPHRFYIRESWGLKGEARGPRWPGLSSSHPNLPFTPLSI